MLTSVRFRVLVLLTTGLFLGMGEIETAVASCSIKQVCKAVEKEIKNQAEDVSSTDSDSSEKDSEDQAGNDSSDNSSDDDVQSKQTMTLTDAIKDAVKSHCDKEVYNSDCPLDQVIELCWENKTKVVVKRCKD